MPPRWKRRVEVVHDALPYANGPNPPGLGIPVDIPMLSSGPDAPLSARARRIFYGVIVAIVAAGIALVALSR